MKSILNGRRPSSAMIVGAVAMILALGGTAAAVEGLNGTQKKQVKKIATNEISKRAPSWALVNAAGTSILAQSGGITVTGHDTGRTGLRFPFNASKAAINAQVTAFGVAGTGAGLFFTKVGPCPASSDCTTVGGSAKTDVVVDTFAPNGDFADAGTYVTLTR